MKRFRTSLIILLVAYAFSRNALACSIMFAGDQITRGDGPQPSSDYGVAGFRLQYQMNLAAAGLSCDFVGDQHDGYDNNTTDGFTFDPDWQGGTNLFADVLANSIGSKVEQYQPDIVFVHTGTYDVLAQLVPSGPGMILQPPAVAAQDVMRVVDTIHSVRPSTQIVLMIPGTGNPRNSALVGLRTNLLLLLGTRQFVSVVDLSLVLRASADYIALELPNPLGYARIGEVLFGVTEPMVRALQPVPVPPAFLMLGSALVALGAIKRK